MPYTLVVGADHLYHPHLAATLEVLRSNTPASRNINPASVPGELEHQDFSSLSIERVDEEIAKSGFAVVSSGFTISQDSYVSTVDLIDFTEVPSLPSYGVEGRALERRETPTSIRLNVDYQDTHSRSVMMLHGDNFLSATARHL